MSVIGSVIDIAFSLFDLFHEIYSTMLKRKIWFRVIKDETVTQQKNLKSNKIDGI